MLLESNDLAYECIVPILSSKDTLEHTLALLNSADINTGIGNTSLWATRIRAMGGIPTACSADGIQQGRLEKALTYTSIADDINTFCKFLYNNRMEEGTLAFYLKLVANNFASELGLSQGEILSLVDLDKHNNATVCSILTELHEDLKDLGILYNQTPIEEISDFSNLQYYPEVGQLRNYVDTVLLFLAAYNTIGHKYTNKKAPIYIPGLATLVENRYVSIFPIVGKRETRAPKSIIKIYITTDKGDAHLLTDGDIFIGEQEEEGIIPDKYLFRYSSGSSGKRLFISDVSSYENLLSDLNKEKASILVVGTIQDDIDDFHDRWNYHESIAEENNSFTLDIAPVKKQIVISVVPELLLQLEDGSSTAKLKNKDLLVIHKVLSTAQHQMKRAMYRFHTATIDDKKECINNRIWSWFTYLTCHDTDIKANIPTLCEPLSNISIFSDIYGVSPSKKATSELVSDINKATRDTLPGYRLLNAKGDTTRSVSGNFNNLEEMYSNQLLWILMSSYNRGAPVHDMHYYGGQIGKMFALMSIHLMSLASLTVTELEKICEGTTIDKEKLVDYIRTQRDIPGRLVSGIKSFPHHKELIQRLSNIITTNIMLPYTFNNTYCADKYVTASEPFIAYSKIG